MTKPVLPKPRKAATPRKSTKSAATVDGAVDEAATTTAAAKKPAVKKPAAAKKPAAKKPAAKTLVVKRASKDAGDTARKKKAVMPDDGGEILAAAPDDNASLQLILGSLEDMKAEETVTIDMRGKSAFTDFIVVTSGRSNRHVGSCAERILKALKEAGQKNAHIEGMANCDWVLIDTGEVTVHVFRPEVREFYNLERLWAPGSSAAESA